MSAEQDQAARDKILDKIQKCLRLSKSSEPHEAAAAMRQAQAMMAKWSVSDAELLGLEVKSVLVITPSPFKKSTPLHHAHLTHIIRMAFDVHCVKEREMVNGRFVIAYRYFGIGGKPELAGYAHDVIFRAIWSAWNAYRKANPDLAGIRGARMGFWVGWLTAVKSKIDVFAGSPEEKDLIQKALTSRYGELSKGKSNEMKLSARTHGDGHAAAADFSIHRPMTGSKLKQRQLTHN